MCTVSSGSGREAGQHEDTARRRRVLPRAHHSPREPNEGPAIQDRVQRHFRRQAREPGMLTPKASFLIESCKIVFNDIFGGKLANQVRPHPRSADEVRFWHGCMMLFFVLMKYLETSLAFHIYGAASGGMT